MASAKFWGGPKVSQFPSVPFYGLAMAFWISGCGAFVVTKNAAMKGYNSYDNTRQRQGEIVDAKYVGLGFWKIKYMFKNGPKIYVMNQLSPGALLVDYCGEFINPFRADYKQLTTINSPVTVHFDTSSAIVDSACVDQGPHPFYTMVGLMLSAVLLKSAQTVFSRARNMIIYHSLQATQPGITMLKRQEVHEMLKLPGDGPVAEFFARGHVANQQRFWGSRRAFTEKMREQHDDVTRQLVTAKNAKDLNAMRQEVHNEMERERVALEAQNTTPKR